MRRYYKRFFPHALEVQAWVRALTLNSKRAVGRGLRIPLGHRSGRDGRLQVWTWLETAVSAVDSR